MSSIWSGNESDGQHNNVTDVIGDFLDDFFERLDRHRKKQPRERPFNWKSFTDQPTLSGSGYGVAYLHEPPKGFYWSVKKIQVSGVAPNTALAGRADVFICGTDLRTTTTLSQCPIMAWRDQATSLPSVASYGTEELLVTSRDMLFIAITGGGASQPVTVSAQVLEYVETDTQIVTGG